MADLEIVGFDDVGKELESPQGVSDRYVAKKPVHLFDELTTDSTMDGRDIATDGTKLDLITVTAPVDLDAIAAAQGPGAVILVGSWDASTGLFPVSTLIGETWICNQAGAADGIQFEVNDRVTALINNASTFTYFNNWIKTQYSDAVTSVAGKTGVVVLEEADISDLGTYLDAVAIDSLAKLNALVLDATLGDVADFATAAQGVLAATAMQNEDIDSLAKLNALVLDATLVDASALHSQTHNLISADHPDVDIAGLPLETGSVLIYVSVADGGDDKFTPVNAFVTAGYGGIGVDSADAMADLGVGWEKVAGFDTNIITTPKNVVHNLPNGALGFSKEGLWQISVKVTLTFAEAVGSRTVKVRLWNLTKAAVASPAFNFFVGRDTAGANLAFTLNEEIITADVDDLIQLEVGGGDVFTTVINIGTTFQANHISEYTP